MWGDSCSKGREFESLYCILDGHFFTFISRKNCNLCFKIRKLLKKRLGLAHILKKDLSFTLLCVVSIWQAGVPLGNWLWREEGGTSSDNNIFLVKKFKQKSLRGSNYSLAKCQLRRLAGCHVTKDVIILEGKFNSNLT